jgi:hypothetical protein
VFHKRGSVDAVTHVILGICPQRFTKEDVAGRSKEGIHLGRQLQFFDCVLDFKVDINLATGIPQGIPRSPNS